VEAFDVAHISGTGFVAASAVWQNGKYLSADYQFILSQEKSELDTLADAVVRSLRDNARATAHLIVLDGGKNQLAKVITGLNSAGLAVAVIAAVKPRGKHSSIAAFLTPAGGSVAFDVDSPAHAMLQLLRDEAHDLANRVHRDYREMMPFYEKEGFEKPLVVPLRFHAENGGADDLILIESR
jgi:excinuclease ABC subunit C